MSANAPVKAILSIPTSALSNFTAANLPRIQFFGSTANVHVEGLSRSNLTAFALQSNLAFDFRPVSSASLIPSVAGSALVLSVSTTATVSSLTSLLCSALGACNLPSSSFLSECLNHFTQNAPIGIALASADLPASAWQAYAQLSMAPQVRFSFHFVKI
jgi:hypothetical protein